MKYIDNDMDDLFNKAGRDYPLNTDIRNWDAVQKALDDPGDPAIAAGSKDSMKKYYPLLLLLLIPLAYIWMDNGNIQPKNEKGIAAVNKNEISGSIKKKNEPPATKQVDQHTKPVMVTGSKKERDANMDGENNTADNSIENRKNSDTRQEKIITPAPDQHSDIILINKNSRPALTSLTSRNEKSPYLSHKDAYITEEFLQKGWSRFPPPGISTAPSANPRTAISGNPSIRSLEQPAATTSDSSKIKSDKKLPSFYYQLKAGADISTIKYQEVKKPGSNISLLLGYRFSKHWSLEAGATWAVKKYYTDGRYFDKRGTRIPPAVIIYYLDGGCSMFEFPLGARYMARPGKNSFFATGGLISTVMKKEGYNYKAEVAGTVYDGYWNYKNSGNYLFSELQLAAGYQYKLFRNINFIIEPYLQMPLRKIGIGKMPVTSAGLHFGLLHEIR